VPERIKKNLRSVSGSQARAGEEPQGAFIEGDGKRLLQEKVPATHCT
jgi:hypothetical protein